MFGITNTFTTIRGIIHVAHVAADALTLNVSNLFLSHKAY